MIRFLALLFAFILPSVADAGWNYILQPNGLYVYSDGLTNNGYYYNRVCSAGGYYNCCYYPGTCSYVQVVPIKSEYKEEVGIKYREEGWETDLIKEVSRLKRAELFVKAANQAGLRIDETSLPASYRYATNGSRTTIQGYAQTGNTIQGYAAQPSGQFQSSANEYLHLQERVVGRAMELGSQGQNYIAANLNTALQGDIELAKIDRIGNTFAVAFTEAMKAAQPTRAEHTTWQTQPVDYGSTQKSPEEEKISALGTVRGKVNLKTVCAACHSGQNPKTKLDFRNLEAYDLAQRKTIFDEAKRRLFSDDPSVIMPPPDKGTLTLQQKLEILSAVSY